jgi:hypothetical protein
VIPVIAAQEPARFDEEVRRPGLKAIRELTGRQTKRRGRPRKAIAKRPQDIPPAAFPPFWRKSIPWLRKAYEGRCAYLATFIEPGTGSTTVDHFIPKSKNWKTVYEWSNLRLCAGLINGFRSDRFVLDPFLIGAEWFALEFVGFQVTVGPQAPATGLGDIEATLRHSGINERGCCELRQEYVTAFGQSSISWDYLNRRAPFVAAELVRQGRVVLLDGVGVMVRDHRFNVFAAPRSAKKTRS